MNLNLSGIVGKPQDESQIEKLKKSQFDTKYESYLSELKKFQDYLEPQLSDSDQLENPNNIILGSESSVQYQNHELSEEDQKSPRDQRDQEEQKHHDAEMIRIKLMKLGNTLAKQKSLLKQANQNIQILNLSQNSIDAKFLQMNMKLLQELFSQNKIIELNLSYNMIGDDGIKELINVFQNQNGSFKILNLRSNCITHQSSQVISQIMIRNENLELDISQNSLKDQFFQQIVLERSGNGYNVIHLILEICDLSDRTIIILTENLKLFPFLTKINLDYNNFKNQQLIEDLQVKILLRQKSKKWDQDLPLPIQSEQSSDITDLYFTDLNDLLTLKYIFEKTQLIISDRILTLNQQKIEHIFQIQNKIIQKFLNLYHRSITQVSSNSEFSSPMKGGDQNKNINLAPMPLKQEIISSSIDLVQSFRSIALQSNITVLDISNNNLADANLTRGINMLKICSHKLSVLILDGNNMSFHSLKSLKSIIEKLGITHINMLSLRNCGIKCNCQQSDYNPNDFSSFRSKAQINKCQVEMLICILEIISEDITYLDLSDNKEIGICFMLHINMVKMIKIRTLKLCSITQDQNMIKKFKTYLRQNSQILDFQLISPDMAFNPTILSYYKQKIQPIIQENQEKFKKENKIQDIQKLFLNMRLSIINDNMYINTDHIYFFSDSFNKQIKFYQAFDFKTNKKYILIPDDQALMIQKEDQGIWLNNLGFSYYHFKDGIKRCYIYENFDYVLLDLIKQSNQSEINGKIGGSDLDKLQISKLVLDFYEKFARIKQAFFFHSSQLVIIRLQTDFVLKLLPYKPFFDYTVMLQDVKQQEDLDISTFRSTLNSFINEQILPNKIKIHALKKYWKYVFSINSNSSTDEEYLQKQTMKVQRLIKNIKDQKALYDKNTLQMLNVALLILNDIYGMKLNFKKHKDAAIQMDKLLLKFFLKCNEEDQENQDFNAIGGIDVEIKSASSSNYNDEEKIDTFLADNVYLRLSQLLNQ
ncbi:UNKNOWN [Stylonychia lemnae]|uniref:Leucine rich repeat family protein n=1 Tax=Stylonychia lemnae TaxID=5949 RepID=A0A078AAT8_STYLE|nr:UNKNOWN [Stylonychia lemnae]|eukprot:CDW78961.1 UNKNOWN [Stylonychia lemnae]